MLGAKKWSGVWAFERTEAQLTCVGVSCSRSCAATQLIGWIWQSKSAYWGEVLVTNSQTDFWPKYFNFKFLFLIVLFGQWPVKDSRTSFLFFDVAVYWLREQNFVSEYVHRYHTLTRSFIRLCAEILTNFQRSLSSASNESDKNVNFVFVVPLFIVLHM